MKKTTKSSAPLPSIKQLFSKSFDLFSSSWKLFFWVIFLPILATLALLVILGFIIAPILLVGGGDITTVRLPLIIPPAFVGLLALFIISAFGKISLINTIQLKGKTTIKQLIKSAWPLVFKYIFLQIILILIVLLGLVLLVIPGLIFAVWFGFAAMVLVVEKVGVKIALKRSRNYVRGRFWPITGRAIVPILFLIIYSLSASFIESGAITVLFQLVTTFVLAPIIAIYFFNLYLGVKSSA